MLTLKVFKKINVTFCRVCSTLLQKLNENMLQIISHEKISRMFKEIYCRLRENQGNKSQWFVIKNPQKTSIFLGSCHNLNMQLLFYLNRFVIGLS